MSDFFRFQIDSEAVAQKLLDRTAESVEKVKSAVEALSVQTHLWIIEQTKELPDWQRPFFLGGNESTPKNVRWVKVADGIWVVEIDESARWIEEGRGPKSMATTEWLLKGPITPHGTPGVHQAKDGSLYRSIPFSQAQGKGKQSHFKNRFPEIEKMVKTALRSQKISLNKIESDSNGQPVLNKTLHKINIDPASAGAIKGQGGKDWYSKPRDEKMAALTGLKQHGGIFVGKDVVVMQREGPRGGVIKEAVTFRTVSSKHQAEGRWMSPAVTPFNSIPRAYEWAKLKWEEMVRDMQMSFDKEE